MNASIQINKAQAETLVALTSGLGEGRIDGFGNKRDTEGPLYFTTSPTDYGYVITPSGDVIDLLEYEATR